LPRRYGAGPISALCETRRRTWRFGSWKAIPPGAAPHAGAVAETVGAAVKPRLGDHNYRVRVPEFVPRAAPGADWKKIFRIVTEVFGHLIGSAKREHGSRVA
jgi:hypothetical protein